MAADAPELHVDEGKPVRAINAVVPILVLIGGVLGGLWATGTGDSLRDIIGTANSNTALMWGSLLPVTVAVALTLAQRILTLTEIVDAWYAGLKQMLYALIILVLAWSLTSVVGGLQTASYLVSILGESLAPGMVPSMVFVLAAATAFATGSSWATMGILMPLVMPLVWAVLTAAGAQEQMHILYSAVSCVISGAVLGDHISPISDTTILSSMASGCDHIEHVRTQLPYALIVGAVGGSAWARSPPGSACRGGSECWLEGRPSTASCATWASRWWPPHRHRGHQIVELLRDRLMRGAGLGPSSSACSVFTVSTKKRFVQATATNHESSNAPTSICAPWPTMKRHRHTPGVPPLMVR